MKSLLDRRILVARSEAQSARAQLLSTVNELRRRLDPRVVASETVEHAVGSATRLLNEAATAARSRPWMLGLGATAAGLLMAARSRRDTPNDDATNLGAES